MLTILHTNDLHDCLNEVHVDRIRAMRNLVSPDVLLFDAGDAVRSSNITYRSDGELVLERMNRIGYDAMTVGNREFHFSNRGFIAKLRLARFPVLCANVYRSRRPRNRPTRREGDVTSLLSMQADSLPILPYTIIQQSNLRVAVLGLTVPMITPAMTVSRLSNFLFQDPLVAARQWVSTIAAKEQPDLLVALTHIGLQKDRLLAVSCPEINLIVGGHSHDLLEKGECVGSTLIVQAGSHAHYIGKVVVDTFPQSEHRLCMSASLEALS